MTPDRVAVLVESLDRSERRRTVIIWGLLVLAMVGAVTGAYGLYLADSGHNADQTVISILSERLCRHDIADALNAEFRRDVRAFLGARTPAERLFAEQALGQPEPRVNLAKCGHPIQLQEVPVPIPVLSLPPIALAPSATTTTTTTTLGPVTTHPTSPAPPRAPPSTTSTTTSSTVPSPPPPCTAVAGVCVLRR